MSAKVVPAQEWCPACGAVVATWFTRLYVGADLTPCNAFARRGVSISRPVLSCGHPYY